MSARRIVVLPWLLYALLAGMAVGCVFYASRVVANEQTFSSVDEDGKLTISPKPCEKAGPWFAKWRSANWLYRGKHYDACWTFAQTRDGGQTIVVIDSDGQISNMDPRRFRPDEAI